MHGCIITEYNDDIKGFLQFYKKLGILPIKAGYISWDMGQSSQSMSLRPQ